VSNEDQLRWEARLRAPAAAAAFAAGVLLLAGTALLLSLSDDRRRVEPRADFLLSVDESPGTLIAATGLQAAAALCLILVFYYLFRATVHRNPVIPRWFSYIVFVGPAMYAIAQVINAVIQVDVAQQVADLPRPRILGEAGQDRVEDLLQDEVSPVAIGLGLAGSVSIAFLFVMLPLRARRVGLMSPFLSVLGVIAGVLFVVPLLPGAPVVIQAFWLGAVGALILGRGPGGRGPAWETGEAEPWPSPARRGLGAGGEVPDEPPEAPEPAAPSEPAAPPERPDSRKRRRKRR
jgi:hypothetical protein